MRSYQAALALDPPISMQEFDKVNEDVLAKINETPVKPVKRARDSESDIEEPKGTSRKAIDEPQKESRNHKADPLEKRIIELHRILDQKIQSKERSSEIRNTKRSKYLVLLKKSEMLNTYTILNFASKNTPKCDFEQVMTCFEKIVSLNLSKKLFNSTKLQKLIKLFKTCLEPHTDLGIKRLVQISDKLLKYWNKLLLLSEFAEKEEPIDDFKEKRNQVYTVLAKLLEQKGIAVLSCRSAAVKIEKNIRKCDPGMGKLYFRKYNELVEDISIQTTLTLDDIIQKYYTQIG